VNAERIVEADEAVRRALGELLLKWVDGAGPGRIDFGAMSREALVGAIKPLAEMAADWGIVGQTSDEIAEGFRRTVQLSIEIHCASVEKPIGWAVRELEDQK
jgi:hypothetical protein